MGRSKIFSKENTRNRKQSRSQGICTAISGFCTLTATRVPSCEVVHHDDVVREAPRARELVRLSQGETATIYAGRDPMHAR